MHWKFYKNKIKTLVVVILLSSPSFMYEPLKFLVNKNRLIVFGQLVEFYYKKKSFSNSFCWTSELHILQAFRKHLARPIPTLYESFVENKY